MKESQKTLTEDLVLSNAMSDALLRKLNFIAKKLQMSEVKRNESEMQNSKFQAAYTARGCVGVFSGDDNNTMHNNSNGGLNTKRGDNNNNSNIDTETIDDLFSNKKNHQSSIDANKIDANMESLKIVTDQLQKHIESRASLKRDVDLTKRYNTFMENQVFGSGGGDIKSKLKSMVSKTRKNLFNKSMNASRGGGHGELLSAAKEARETIVQNENEPEVDDDVIAMPEVIASMTMSAKTKTKTKTKTATPKFDKITPRKPEVGSFTKSKQSPNNVLRQRQKIKMQHDKFQRELKSENENSTNRKFSVVSSSNVVMTSHDEVKAIMNNSQRRKSIVRNSERVYI